MGCGEGPENLSERKHPYHPKPLLKNVSLEVRKTGKKVPDMYRHTSGGQSSLKVLVFHHWHDRFLLLPHQRHPHAASTKFIKNCRAGATPGTAVPLCCRFQAKTLKETQEIHKRTETQNGLG